MTCNQLLFDSLYLRKKQWPRCRFNTSIHTLGQTKPARQSLPPHLIKRNNIFVIEKQYHEYRLSPYKKKTRRQKVHKNVLVFLSADRLIQCINLIVHENFRSSRSVNFSSQLVLKFGKNAFGGFLFI